MKRCTCVNKQKHGGIKHKYNQDTDGLSQFQLESVGHRMLNNRDISDIRSR